MFVSRQAVMIIQLALLAVMLIMNNRARAGQKIPAIRRLAGLDAIDEAIGRATEMGRPVLYFPGRGSLSNAQTLASFEVLAYVSRACARFDTGIIATSYAVPVYSVIEGLIKDNFVAVGKAENFSPTMARFMGVGWGATTSATQGVIRREQVAASFIIGQCFADTMMIADTGAAQGAIQVGGTAQADEIPYLVAACDYTLIGEEIFAAGAYLSTDEVPKSNLVTQDYFKVFAVLLIIVGAVTKTMGQSWLAALLNR